MRKLEKIRIIDLLNFLTSHLRNHEIDNPRLEAELLVGHYLGFSREKLYIHLNDLVKEKDRERILTILERRKKDEPIQYIIGHREFWSLDIKVTPKVFIPRPETEILVEHVILILKKENLQKDLSILELGTGSGAISISLAKELENISLIATDISFEAILLAKENAIKSGIDKKIKFICGDLFNPFRFINRGYFDMIISNPPYIKSSEIMRLQREIKNYEPIIAIDGGEDGLKFHRRIIEESTLYLKKEGWLLMEIGHGQGDSILGLIKEKECFKKVEIVKDLSGLERLVKIKKE